MMAAPGRPWENRMRDAAHPPLEPTASGRLLPFVMGVLSDLSGNNPGVEKPAAYRRRPWRGFAIAFCCSATHLL